jgi:hypothetical protein
MLGPEFPSSSTSAWPCPSSPRISTHTIGCVPRNRILPRRGDLCSLPGTRRMRTQPSGDDLRVPVGSRDPGSRSEPVNCSGPAGSARQAILPALGERKLPRAVSVSRSLSGRHPIRLARPTSLSSPQCHVHTCPVLRFPALSDDRDRLAPSRHAYRQKRADM